jgi:predicted exporter
VNLTSKSKLYIWLGQCITLILFLVFILIDSPLTFNANLTSLFSDNKNNEWQNIQKKIDTNLNTSLLYLVGHQNQNKAIIAAEHLVETVTTIKGISHVSAKLTSIPTQQNMIDSYKGFEQQLLTSTFRAFLVQENKQVFDLQFQLLNQLGDQLVVNTISKDPTLAFANFLNRSPFPSSKLTITADGYLTVNYQNITYVLVTMKTLQGAFNLDSATSIVSQLNNIKQSKNVEYIRTGAIFYSVEASEKAQKEMKWLGGLSIIITLFLIYFAYRHFITILSTVFLISMSIVYGFLGVNLFFDEINILSMVFAITLIGIAADYSFHSLTELQGIPFNEKHPLKNINSSLILSFLTTALGYLLLVVVPIVIFKQIAVFTIFGLFGALITVLLVFPYLHQRFNFTNNNNSFFENVNRKHQTIMKNWQRYLLLLIALLLLSTIALFQIKFSDNAKSFYQVSEQLLKSEKTVKKMLGQKLDNQYLLIKASSQQELLEYEEQAIILLEKMQMDNVFISYQAVASWLPSIKQQKHNKQLLLNAAEQGQFNSLREILGKNSFDIKPTKEYLLVDQWFGTPVGKIFKHLWLQDENGYYSIIKFAGITNTTELSEGLSVLENSIFVDKLADTAVELATFRLVLTVIFMAACLAGFTVFYFRYGLKKACCGVLVPASAFAISLALSASVQGNLTLFNLAAGLVILALGLDYSIFYAEHGFSTSITKTTLMSALSSIFVFAVLSFSSTPAIASFGQTVFWGIVITFLFSPIVTKISGKRGNNASK